MRILLTNDDGIEAPGLQALYHHLARDAEVAVVAPHRCRSGTAHSITYREPLRFEEVTLPDGTRGVAVHGSPADCVKLAHHVLLETPVDLVVSGINRGANVGLNLYYSGTVAAALEAVFLGIPGLALSVACGDGEPDFERVARAACAALQRLWPWPAGTALNVNLPDPAGVTSRGLRAASQATGGFAESYADQTASDGSARYQLRAGPFAGPTTSTDAGLLQAGYTTVTPLRVGMTHEEQLDRLQARLAQGST